MSFGSEAIKLLTSYDVDTIFGIPGVHTIEYFRGVLESNVTAIIPRHEQGAGFMADGYARVSNKPGVCVLVSGPGVLNAATPIAQAWHDSIPLLVVAASTESELRGKNRGALHDIPDQSAFFEQITDLSITVTDPDHYAEVVEQTFSNWKSQRCRPVHISIPFDLLDKKISPIKKVEIKKAQIKVSIQQIDEIIKKILESKRIVLLCGGGANKASSEIIELAQILKAPVITTGNARGLIPDQHPLNAGTTLPFQSCRELLDSSDLVLAIGTEFSDVDVIYTGKRITQPAYLVRVDIDSAQLQSAFIAKVAVQADAKEFTSTLIAMLKSRDFVSHITDAADRAQKVRMNLDWTEQSKSHFVWLDVITNEIPRNTIISIDSTQLAYTSHHYLPWSSPQRWLAPYGLGTLGPALPMGIGAKIASPQDPVVILAGDGGALFTIAELATARDIGGTIILIIWDNAGYAEIRDSFDRAKAVRIGVDVSAFDLTAIAKGFGVKAVRVTTPTEFKVHLQRALGVNEPTVIVITEPS